MMIAVCQRLIQDTYRNRHWAEQGSKESFLEEVGPNLKHECLLRKEVGRGRSGEEEAERSREREKHVRRLKR